MRGGLKARHVEEEEESAFISMTDMTVSFLFVIMILLAFFATQIAPQETVSRTEYDRVTGALSDRDGQVIDLLEELERYRSKDIPSARSLQVERDRLRQELRELQNNLAAVRNSLGLTEGKDAALEAARLRTENDRLHRLLDASEKVNPIERYAAQVSAQREALLTQIRERIKAADSTIEVEISQGADALEFKGEGLFPSNLDKPTGSGAQKMKAIANVLRTTLGCFTRGPNSSIQLDCNPDLVFIDAVQVEGHTDSTGSDTLNMGLSSRRGASIFDVMVSASPEILEFQNLRRQPVLSVAGYGEGRPIGDNATPEGRDSNRRIDLRFIMFAPTQEQLIPNSLDDLDRLRELLTSSLPQ